MAELLDLETLSTGDKVLVAAQLLRRATEESEEMDIDAGVLSAIEERLEHLEENPSSGLSWEEVKKSLRRDEN